VTRPVPEVDRGSRHAARRESNAMPMRRYASTEMSGRDTHASLMISMTLFDDHLVKQRVA
jgi:hypothetical protein